MATDLIRYDLLVQDALRGVVKTVLSDAARNGLQGDHHFFITFKTNAPGLRLSDRMRERYPDEMTIILQHQFWDLAVTEHAFEVGLSFSNKPERLLVPFLAITTFHDPSVQFGLKFDLVDGLASNVDKADAEDAPAPAPEKAPAGKRMLTAVETTGKMTAPAALMKPAEAKPVKATLTKMPEPAATKESSKLVPANPEGHKADAKPDGNEPQKVVSIDAFRKKP